MQVVRWYVRPASQPTYWDSIKVWVETWRWKGFGAAEPEPEPRWRGWEWDGLRVVLREEEVAGWGWEAWIWIGTGIKRALLVIVKTFARLLCILAMLHAALFIGALLNEFLVAVQYQRKSFGYVRYWQWVWRDVVQFIRLTLHVFMRHRR